MNRTFGLELEVERPDSGPAAHLSYEDMVGKLTAGGVHARTPMGHYSHTVTSWWKVVSDATVSGGMELVSPILRGEVGFAELKKVTTVLNELNMGVSRATGFHVHIGVEDLTGPELFAIVTRYAKYEKTIDAFMAKSRRESVSTYTMSIESWPAVPAMQRAQTPQELANAVPGSSDTRRYHKVNLEAFRKYGTLEFRQHQGTADFEKIKNWVLFLQYFIEETLRQFRGQSAPAPASVDVLSKVKKTYRGQTTKAWLVAKALLEAPGTGLSRKELSELVGQEETQISVILQAFRERNLGLVKTRVLGRDGIKKLYKLMPAMAVGTVEEDGLYKGMPIEVADFYKARTEHFRERASRNRNLSGHNAAPGMGATP